MWKWQASPSLEAGVLILPSTQVQIPHIQLIIRIPHNGKIPGTSAHFVQDDLSFSLWPMSAFHLFISPGKMYIWHRLLWFNEKYRYRTALPCALWGSFKELAHSGESIACRLWSDFRDSECPVVPKSPEAACLAKIDLRMSYIHDWLTESKTIMKYDRREEYILQGSISIYKVSLGK